MTTTVRILVEGNKQVKAYVVEADGVTQQVGTEKIIEPGSFGIFHIHGDKFVKVQETGDFVS